MSKLNVMFTEQDFLLLSKLARSGRYLATHSEAVCRLRTILERGVVISGRHMPPDVVTMRSRVQVKDVRTRETGTYTLTYPDDADIDKGRLSVLAPLGTALLGARERELLRLGISDGECRLCVQRILYQPEASGRYDL